MVKMTAEAVPLLPADRRATGSRRVVAVIACLAAVAAVTLVALRLPSSPTVLLADGVEPVNKLSFTRAEKAHFQDVQKLDDVSSRSAIDSYFNGLSAVEAKEHTAAETKSSARQQQSLNAYYDSLGQQYHKATVYHAMMRADRHPGKLSKMQKKVRKDISADENAVDTAIDEGVTSGETATQDQQGEAEAKADDSASTALSAPAQKVKLGFYMESMCPGCKYFTVNVLKELMAKPDFAGMVDLKVYPYGNGQLSGTKIACQHGADECEGNKIIACMQNQYAIHEFIPAFVCMEGKDGKPRAEAEACASKHSLDWAKINSCAQSDEGSKLALDAAQATESLVPAHEYAPWITMNGVPLRDKAYDLQAVVCDAFTGTKPSMCSKTNLKLVTQQALKTINTVGFEVCPRRDGKI